MANPPSTTELSDGIQQRDSEPTATSEIMSSDIGGFMQAHLPYSQIHRQDRTSASSVAPITTLKSGKVGQGKIWRNTLMMVLLFVLTYWLALYWLLPSVGTVAAGIKAPIVCLVFWLGCSFGDRAAKYRRR